MEFKGEEFVKKVQLKQEKETLKLRLQDLEDQDTVKEPNSNIRIDTQENLLDLPEQELGDILLSNSDEPADKKKYIILGLVLVVLFLITIIIIRLVTTSDNDKNDSFVNKKENISQDKILDDENIEQQYQKIIKQKMKKRQEEKIANQDAASLKAQEALNIKKTQKEEIKTNKEKEIQEVKKAKEIKKELLILKEKPKKVLEKELKKSSSKQVVQPKKAVKKEEKTSGWPVKKQTLREPAVTDFTKARNANKLNNTKTVIANSGYFIQLGAFTKKPSDSYLNKIKQSGFNYKLYNETIQNTKYIKVLVGPYPSRAVAEKNMPNVKSKIGLKSAFVKQLK